MTNPELLVPFTVTEVLTRFPQLVRVFNRRGMACPGCELSGLETLGEAIALYHLDRAAFLVELAQAINSVPAAHLEENP